MKRYQSVTDAFSKPMDFKKDNKLLKPIVIAVNGELVDVAKLSQIAALPSKDQAISILMTVMQLPIEKFVRTLSAPNIKLVQTKLYPMLERIIIPRTQIP